VSAMKPMTSPMTIRPIQFCDAVRSPSNMSIFPASPRKGRQGPFWRGTIGTARVGCNWGRKGAISSAALAWPACPVEFAAAEPGPERLVAARLGRRAGRPASDGCAPPERARPD
jgi:hypothetical protein